MKMTKAKLPIIVVAVLALVGAGLYFTGIVGGEPEGPTKKHVIEPVALAEPFTVKLLDSDEAHYVAFNVAVQLEPMDEAHWLAFSGAGGGGHGGGGEAPGPGKVATYPKFRDAVITTASGFSKSQLDTLAGQAELKTELLAKFHEIAETDAAEAKAGAAADDPLHLGPPYHVMDVFFTKFIVD